MYDHTFLIVLLTKEVAMPLNSLPICYHPHWTVDDVFRYPLKLVSAITERDYSTGVHTHDFYEINIVLRGKGVHYIGENRLDVEVGDIFIVPPSVPHAYEGGVGFDVYHLLLNPQYLGKYAADLQMLSAFPVLFRLEPLMRQRGESNLHLHLQEDEFDQIYPLLDQIILTAKEKNAENRILCNSLTMILITHICVYYEKKLQNEERNAPEDREFLRSLSYLYDHYQEKICIEDLAKIAKTSRSSYVTKFKRNCGLAPGEFLTHHRLDVAQSLLRETSMTLTEIATATGFYDSSHLIRAFLKHRGISPTEYRSSMKK